MLDVFPKTVDRRKLVSEFLGLSEGSFSTVYQALNAAARENRGARDLKTADVRRHISRIRSLAKTQA